MKPISWNIEHLVQIYELPENATISIDDREITVTASLIYTILIRSAQELFPELDKERLHQISVLTLHQIGNYAKAMNRSETDEFSELPALMSTDRKLLRRIFKIDREGLISTQTRSLVVIHNLSKTP